MTKLVPFTLDELNKLSGLDRANALREYQAWLERQRKTDRSTERNLKYKILRFKKPEYIEKMRMKSYLKNNYGDNKKCIDCDNHIMNNSTRCYPCYKKQK